MCDESRTIGSIDPTPLDPTESLSSEILCNIFLELAMINRDDSTSSISTMYVSQVCRRWRDTALSYGDLWSLLFIRFYGYAYLDTKRFERYRNATIKIFDSWLQRTNGCSLYFTLICEDMRVPDHASNLAAEHMVGAMLSQQHRWKRVHFEWSFRPSPAFAGVVATNMPSLMALCLEWYNSDDSAGGERARRAVIDISRSRSLQKLKLLAHYELETGPTPINTLIEPCTLEYLNETPSRGIRASWKFLQSAVNLNHFCLLVRQCDSDIPKDLPNLNLPNLRVLQDQLPGCILDKLTATSLEALSCGSRYGSYTYGGPFLRFVRRSMPPLTYLRIKGIGAGEDDLISALYSLPTLRRLDTSWTNASARLFWELTYDSMNTDKNCGEIHPLCPELCVFHLDIDGYFDDIAAFIDALNDMIMSRWSYMGSFTRIIFGCTQYELPGSPLTVDHPDYDYVRRSMEVGGGMLIEGDDGPRDPFEIPHYEWKDE